MNRNMSLGEFLSMLNIRKTKLDNLIRDIETLVCPPVDMAGLYPKSKIEKVLGAPLSVKQLFDPLPKELVMAEIKGGKYKRGSKVPIKRIPIKLRKRQDVDVVAKPDSIHATAFKILKMQAKGLSTFDLLASMKRINKPVGGKNPVATLHSVLYRRKQMFGRKDDKWVART